MVLMIRQWIVLLKSLLQSSEKDPQEESVLTFRVWFGDLDSWFNIFLLIPQILLLALRPSRARDLGKRRPTMTYYKYSQLATLGRLSIMLQVLGMVTRKGYRGVIGAETIKYRHGLRLFQKFQVRTRLLNWDDTWFYLQSVFEYQDMVMCTVFAKVATRNWSGLVAPSEALKNCGVSLDPAELEPGQKAVFDALE